MSMQLKVLQLLWMMRLLLQNSEKNGCHTNPGRDNELTIITPEMAVIIAITVVLMIQLRIIFLSNWSSNQHKLEFPLRTLSGCWEPDAASLCLTSSRISHTFAPSSSGLWTSDRFVHHTRSDTARAGFIIQWCSRVLGDLSFGIDRFLVQFWCGMYLAFDWGRDNIFRNTVFRFCYCVLGIYLPSISFILFFLLIFYLSIYIKLFLCICYLH